MVGYSFLVTDGPDQGRTFVLQSGITLLGRLDAPAPDDPPGSLRWTLTDPAISRTHAQIIWDGETAPILVHLSTTNATLLDGRIVTGQRLEDGQSLKDRQKLRMGQTGLEVHEIAVGSAWRLNEGESEHTLHEEQWPALGVAFAANAQGLKIVLVDDSLEAYVLRRIDHLWWSTPLKPKTPVMLFADDVLRLGERRLVVRAAEG